MAPPVSVMAGQYTGTVDLSFSFLMSLDGPATPLPFLAVRPLLGLP